LFRFEGDHPEGSARVIVDGALGFIFGQAGSFDGYAER